MFLCDIEGLKVKRHFKSKPQAFLFLLIVGVKLNNVLMFNLNFNYFTLYYPVERGEIQLQAV